MTDWYFMKYCQVSSTMSKNTQTMHSAPQVFASAAAEASPAVDVIPGTGIDQGAWSSWPPYTPSTTEQQIFAKLHAYQEPACLQAAFSVPQRSTTCLERMCKTDATCIATHWWMRFLIFTRNPITSLLFSPVSRTRDHQHLTQGSNP